MDMEPRAEREPCRAVHMQLPHTKASFKWVCPTYLYLLQFAQCFLVNHLKSAHKVQTQFVRLHKKISTFFW